MSEIASPLSKPKSRFEFRLFPRFTTLVVQPPVTATRYESRVDEYLHKCIILKQIMSNKARKFRRINAAQNVATVVVTGLLLFLGFSGLEKITLYVSWIYQISRDATELGFNFLVFALFIIAILHLVFRFPEKQGQAERAIAMLASLSNEISDLITSHGNLVISEEPSRVEIIRTKYEAIAQSIPANSDGDYIRAKFEISKKEQQKPSLSISSQRLFDQSEQENIVASIALGSREIVDVLLSVRKIDANLYVGGGLIRNAIWDYLHKYTSNTPVDDIDVIYFDGDKAEKRFDKEIEKKLQLEIKNRKWSTKNQARMHIFNKEDPYASLEDAISRWPETATAFVVRLLATGKIEFVAPHGFDDLLRLIVTNTPAFANRIDTIRLRVESKEWQRIWPNLKLVLPAPLSVASRP